MLQHVIVVPPVLAAEVEEDEIELGAAGGDPGADRRSRLADPLPLDLGLERLPEVRGMKEISARSVRAPLDDVRHGLIRVLLKGAI
jgi:hypothetical protein